jgi:hypothetical protein
LPLQLSGYGENIFLSDTKILKFLYNSSQGGGGYLPSFVEAIFWAIGAAVVGGIPDSLRGGG